MTIHTENMAVLCTTNLPRHEADILSELIEAGQVSGMSRDTGWMIPTKPLREPANQQTTHLNYVLGYLRAKGFDWALFDCDAEPCDELTEFTWEHDLPAWAQDFRIGEHK